MQMPPKTFSNLTCSEGNLRKGKWCTSLQQITPTHPLAHPPSHCIPHPLPLPIPPNHSQACTTLGVRMQLHARDTSNPRRNLQHTYTSYLVHPILVGFPQAPVICVLALELCYSEPALMSEAHDRISCCQHLCGGRCSRYTCSCCHTFLIPASCAERS